MTSPLSSQAYPSTPAAPSSSPEGYVNPGTIASPNGTPLTPEQIAAQRGNFIELILREVVRAITGVFLPVGAAFDQLVNWVQNILPDWITQPINDLIELLITVLDLIPIIGAPAGDTLEYLASIFGLLRDRDVVQQASADTANVGIAILNARINGIIIGGASLYDTFSRNVTDIATDPAYDVEYFNGPGTMNLSTADSGVARWAALGYSDAAFIARDVTTPMTTNVVRLSTVVGSFIYGDAGNQAHVKLMGRMDATRQNYVIGMIEGTVAEIGYVLAGVYTRMGAAVSVTASAGDLWDFEIGTLGDEWQFRLLQNNAERVVRNDLGHASHKDTTPGTTYKYVAFGGDCAIVSAPFFTTAQAGMPDFQVFAAADY